MTPHLRDLGLKHHKILMTSQTLTLMTSQTLMLMALQTQPE